jgi:integrase/recombinase XerD
MAKRKLLLSQAIMGFLLDAEARSLSPHTIADYQNAFRKLQAFIGDPPMESISADDVRRFLSDLSTPRAPAGIAPRPARSIGKKQKLNIHTGLSALWTWAVAEGYVRTHILRRIERPKPEKPVIEPFTQDDIKRLLVAASRRSAPYTRPGKKESDHERATAVRDRAILLLLVDTGMRASELCGLELRNVDLRNGAVVVFGKGSKERSLPIGPRTKSALSKHILENRAEARVNEPIFLTVTGQPMDRCALLKLVYRLAEVAGVRDAHPHRFRHTFAIQYLRNGGNERTLQDVLGHESLDMLRTYTRIAQVDMINGHQLASPVENWRL